MKVILTAIATAAVLAATAYAGNVTPMQLAALSKRVAALDRRVTALDKDNTALHTYLEKCLNNFEAVIRKPAGGASTPGQGYVYDVGDGTQVDTDALTTTSSSTPDFWFLSAPASCVGKTP